MFNEGKYMFQKVICVCVLISVAFVVPNEASAGGWGSFKRFVAKTAKSKGTKWVARATFPFSAPIIPYTERKPIKKTLCWIGDNVRISGGTDICLPREKDRNGRCPCRSGKPRRNDGTCPPFSPPRLGYPQYTP